MANSRRAFDSKDNPTISLRVAIGQDEQLVTQLYDKLPRLAIKHMRGESKTAGRRCHDAG